MPTKIFPSCIRPAKKWTDDCCWFVVCSPLLLPYRIGWAWLLSLKSSIILLSSKIIFAKTRPVTCFSLAFQAHNGTMLGFVR